MAQEGSPGPDQTRVLRRTPDDKVIAGVCGGLGRYLGIDPVLLRIAFVVLALAGASGVVLYVIAWIVIPEAKPAEPVGERPPSSTDTARLVIGGALIAVGTIALLNVAVPRFGRFFWPMALIAVGIAVIIGASSRR